jgi:hypothetical protein
MYAGSSTVLRPDHHAGVALRIGVEFGGALQRAHFVCDTEADSVQDGRHQEGARLAAGE